MCFHHNGPEKENIMYTVVFGLRWCLIFKSALAFEWLCNQEVVKRLLRKKSPKIINLCQEAMVHSKISEDQSLD